MSDIWKVTEEEKQKIKNKLDAKKDKQNNPNMDYSGNKPLTKTVPYWLQSIVYLVGASLYQANLSSLKGIDLPYTEQLGIAFYSFGLTSWLLLTFVLWTIEKNKPKESRSNTMLYLGIGFFIIWFL
jgi:hypothetical protein